MSTSASLLRCSSGACITVFPIGSARHGDQSSRCYAPRSLRLRDTPITPRFITHPGFIRSETLLSPLLCASRFFWRKSTDLYGTAPSRRRPDKRGTHSGITSCPALISGSCQRSAPPLREVRHQRLCQSAPPPFLHPRKCATRNFTGSRARHGTQCCEVRYRPLCPLQSAPPGTCLQVRNRHSSY